MAKLRFEQIIIDHGRQPKCYHTRLIVFLLAVIVFCLLVIALRGEIFPVRTALKIAAPIKISVPHKTAPAKKAVPMLTMQHIVAQMMVESHGDHGAVSNKGCVGSMQVMPATAAEYGIQEWTLQHPVLGLDAGIRIMTDFWNRWQAVKNPELRWSLALASYNCGHWRAKQFFYGLILRRCGIQARWFRFLPMETLAYIQKIKANYRGAK